MSHRMPTLGESRPQPFTKVTRGTEVKSSRLAQSTHTRSSFDRDATFRLPYSGPSPLPMTPGWSAFLSQILADCAGAPSPSFVSPATLPAAPSITFAKPPICHSRLPSRLLSDEEPVVSSLGNSTGSIRLPLFSLLLSFLTE
jgi:hypothetical protein